MAMPIIGSSSTTRMRPRRDAADTTASFGGSLGRAAVVARRMTRKVLPLPTSLSTSIRPPKLVTMSWQMGRPSPVPTPTGLVVKNGSNNRSRFSAAMPEPVSRTSMARPSAWGRVRTRISLRSTSPSGMAWAAFTSRFTITCPNRPSCASAMSWSVKSRTSRARCLISLEAMLMALSRTRVTSTGSGRACSSARENIFNCRTMSRTRVAPSCASATSLRTSSCSPPGSFNRGSTSVSRWPRLATVKASGLLISWAMPAASVPSEAMRSARTRRASICLRSVKSLTSQTMQGWPSNTLGACASSTKTGVPFLRSMRISMGAAFATVPTWASRGSNARDSAWMNIPSSSAREPPSSSSALERPIRETSAGLA